MTPFRLIVFAAAAVLAAAIGVAYYRPPLRVSHTPEGVRVDVQTLGEYPTSVERVRLRDVASGQVLWDLRAQGKGAQLSTFELCAGSNPAKLQDARWGQFDVAVPKRDAAFRLERGRRYELEVWGTRVWLTAHRAQFRV